jgi:hypothetical protein
MRHAFGSCKPKEMKMMIKTLVPAMAAIIGIGMAIPSSASAVSVRDRYLSAPYAARTYRPPEGQIWERGFQNAPTRRERARQDFELDGAYPR